MPGESPGRDWDALLHPEPVSIWEQRRIERATKERRRRMRIWKGFGLVVLIAIGLGWLSLLPWAARVPDPWNWITIMGWAVALPLILMLIFVVVMRRLERWFLRQTDQELELES